MSLSSCVADLVCPLKTFWFDLRRQAAFLACQAFSSRSDVQPAQDNEDVKMIVDKAHLTLSTT
ncbi:hypothetical protein GFC29_3372 [Anoxybacillus sp. B7M1]|uniref:hypothetical protein n=1 Tax=unclassified Anoxybacillus TaxID=2639704 RepID=UPI0007B5C4EE|nr:MULTISPECIES: hypothetical protein [unclassified Anoxybacillus]ANB57970.1 hypothetical protein GFC28_2062 [Anoxybacillus sp. B2M1]ANB65238.1 hypothetical protein GFC29_3372 [Anoxybacillus sp. B7M1]